MKKVILFLVLILLAGCSTPANNIKDSHPQKPEHSVKPIVVSFGNSDNEGYVVGGLVNGDLISYQHDDNYKLFELTGEESYTLFSADGESATAKTADVDTTFVSAVGAYETTVTFDDGFNSDSRFIGIGNSSQGTVAKKKFIDNNGSFELDFDNDGEVEKITIEKSETIAVVSLENQQGKTNIAEIDIDGIYTVDYELFVADIDQDGSQEFILCKYGHDYSTEIFKITSDSCEKIIEYYMGN